MTELADKLSVAAIQMTSNESPDHNYQVAKELIEKASREGASLIVLPENFLCFSQSGLAEFSLSLDLYIDKLSALASLHKVALVCGSLPFPVDSKVDAIIGKFYAGSLVIGPNGDLLARYNKVHLFDVDVDDSVGQYRESDTYASGNDIVTTKVFGWTLGLSVCYDLRFPELYQAYFKGGAQIISVPSAFTYKTGKAHWEVLLKARAIETQSYIVASNQTGTHSSTRQTWGHSMIVDPWGEVIASCASEVGYCIAEVDQKTISSIRSNMPLMQHKRLI